MKKLFQSALRPSTWVRGFWLAVVVLHAALFVRRLGMGDWNGIFNQAQLALGLGVSIYGLIRIWQPSTFLDASPRKALSLVLLVILGHFAKSPDLYSRAAQAVFADLPLEQIVLIAPILAGVFALMAGVAMMSHRRQTERRLSRVSNRSNRIASPRIRYRNVSLFQRPPPRF